jgi:hypothetical protein
MYIYIIGISQVPWTLITCRVTAYWFGTAIINTIIVAYSAGYIIIACKVELYSPFLLDTITKIISFWWWKMFWKCFGRNVTSRILFHDFTNRGVGTGGAAPPPSFAKCPFSGSKVPLSCVKNVIKIALFDQRALLKTWIYVICGKIFSFPGKISYIRKFFSYLRKNVVYPENVFGMSGKFFWDDLPPPQSPTFPGKNF